jgi:hypothetical protein
LLAHLLEIWSFEQAQNNAEAKIDLVNFAGHVLAQGWDNPDKNEFSVEEGVLSVNQEKGAFQSLRH